MEPSIVVWVLFSACGVIAVVLVILLIYRGTLSSKEDDQIFIDAAEHHHVEEQAQSRPESGFRQRGLEPYPRLRAGLEWALSEFARPGTRRNC